MAKNTGKIFENAIKSSLPSYVLPIRLPDPPQSFVKRSDTRFSRPNPCDYVLWDSKHRILVPVELKTTKYKSMSYEDIDNNEGQSKMIHAHQIVGLQKFSKYDYVIAGFLFNFRDEKNDMERTYFQRIEDFISMTSKSDKKSCNELDILSNGGIKVIGSKKKVHYKWNIEELLDRLCS